jgi:hypothetical protein
MMDRTKAVSRVSDLESAIAAAEAARSAADSDGPAGRPAQVDWAELSAIARHLDPRRLTYYDDAALADLKVARTREPLAAELRAQAESFLALGPYSVRDKTTVAPSGDPNDYWHPAPYWWPDPTRPDGLPYLLRDGERVPGTMIYGPGSDRFDRTRLQRVFDETTILALAAVVHDDPRYADHGARLVRHWFIDPETGMNPHLRFAQVRRGHNNDEGAATGLIEMKDVYFFLDGVRLLERTGALGSGEGAALRDWLRAYALWLETSRQGIEERASPTNHGPMYDVQIAAIGCYLGEAGCLARAFRRSRDRLVASIAADGSLPLELRRTLPSHYCCFHLHGLTTLARIAATVGIDLWSATTDDGRGLELSLTWFLGADRSTWPADKSLPFDEERLEPLRRDLAVHFRGEAVEPARRFAGRPVGAPHDRGAPFWMLAQP